MNKHHLVLLPGLDGTGQLFAPLLGQLPPELTATVVSYPPAEKLSYQQLEPYVQQALPATEPFVLVAESFSGPLAIKLAAAAPENLRAVILCASFVRNPAPTLLQGMGAFNHPFWFQFKWPREMVRYVAALWDCEAEVIDSLIENTSTVPPDVLSYRFGQVLQVDVRAQLQRCQLPMLYLRGTRDLLVMRHNWQEIARLKPDTRLAEIDASHFVLQHKPVEALTAITTFLASNFAA